MTEIRKLVEHEPKQDIMPGWQGQGAMYSVTAAPTGGESYTAKNLGLT